MKPTPSNDLADVPQIDEMLCFSIYSAGHAFNQLYRPLLDEMELTYPQFLVMTALWARDDRTVKGSRRNAFPRLQHPHPAAEAAGKCRPRHPQPKSRR